MENLQERLNQCRKDITVLQEQEKELEKQIEKERFKFGEIVRLVSYGSRRVILYDENGKLVAVGKNGNKVGDLGVCQYKSTGQNIFTDNVLNLDS